MIYEWFLYVVIVGSVGFCQGENSKHVCEFQNLNAVYESSSPIKLTRIIRCCDKIQCGGWEIQVAESGYNVTKIGPDWFINRTLANETAYLIKKKHRRIFQTPVSQLVQCIYE